MKVKNIKNINTTALAYMGDAVYEQAVREHIISEGSYDVNKLHRRATGYVKAGAQAMVVRELFDELTEAEQALVKRARNRKYTTKAKNADPVTYKWATAFEALLGYLYLAEDEERLSWVLERSFEIVGR
ncbi:MAG: Mini-ribonuclease 3 [Clostridiales bacterium]|nr:Mini-ribonuclease 3 [Clostridiales bacterium]